MNHTYFKNGLVKKASKLTSILLLIFILAGVNWFGTPVFAQSNTLGGKANPPVDFNELFKSIKGLAHNPIFFKKSPGTNIPLYLPPNASRAAGQAPGGGYSPAQI